MKIVLLGVLLLLTGCHSAPDPYQQQQQQNKNAYSCAAIGGTVIRGDACFVNGGWRRIS